VNVQGRDCLFKMQYCQICRGFKPKGGFPVDKAKWLFFILLLSLTNCSTPTPASLSDALDQFAAETNKYGFFHPKDLISKDQASLKRNEEVIKRIQCQQKRPNPLILGVEEADVEFSLEIAKSAGASASKNPSAEINVSSTRSSSTRFKIQPYLLSSMPDILIDPLELSLMKYAHNNNLVQDKIYKLKNDKKKLKKEVKKLMSTFSICYCIEKGYIQKKQVSKVEP